MKYSEMLDMTTDELREKIESLHKELFEARFKKATQQLEDTAVFRRKKHEIAQMTTALRQKELKAQGEKVHA